MNIEVGKYAAILPLLQKLKDEEENKILQKINKECEFKASYSKKEAQTVRNYLRKEGRKVREYKCQQCDYWHLTHLIRKKEKFGKKKNKKKLKARD